MNAIVTVTFTVSSNDNNKNNKNNKKNKNIQEQEILETHLCHHRGRQRNHFSVLEAV